MTDAAVMVEWINNLGDYCGPGDIGLVTYLEFSRGLHCYLSREIDEAGLSITGDITLGGWVWFDTQSRGYATAIMGKWREPGDDRAYVLYKKANGEITFAVSETGINNLNEITDSGVNYSIGEWKYIVGRFTASKEISLFVNGNWYSNSQGIFASIHDSDEPFEIARYDRSNYFDGRLCHMFVSAESISDADIEAMYHHTRAMFQGVSEGQPFVPTGIDERASNIALMIEYQATTFLRASNVALMIEYQASKDLRVTNFAVEIERRPTTPEIRVTNDAVMIERHPTTVNAQVTNFAIMVERYPTTSYERVTNYAIMVERSSTSSSTSSSSSSSTTSSSSSSVP